jgi:hypothetical protein
MYLKITMAAVLFANFTFAENVPSDLTVNSFTGKVMNQAVAEALGKPLPKPQGPPRPFATLDLIKALNPNRLQSGRVLLGQMDKQCALPLLELKGGDGRQLDPLAKPAGNGKFDRLARPAMPACHFNIPAAK